MGDSGELGALLGEQSAHDRARASESLDSTRADVFGSEISVAQRSLAAAP